MTKQDILNMKTSAEVTHTIFTHRELWDQEVYEHQMALVQKERIEQLGDSYSHVDLLKKK